MKRMAGQTPIVHAIDIIKTIDPDYIECYYCKRVMHISKMIHRKDIPFKHQCTDILKCRLYAEKWDKHES